MFGFVGGSVDGVGTAYELSLNRAWFSLASQFDRKWVQGDNPGGDPVLGTPEISSLADLGGAYDILATMRAVPFDPADAVALLLAALVPMTPLLLTIMPLDRLLELLSKLLV
jgi:hypothetical protein